MQARGINISVQLCENQLHLLMYPPYLCKTIPKSGQNVLTWLQIVPNWAWSVFTRLCHIITIETVYLAESIWAAILAKTIIQLHRYCSGLDTYRWICSCQIIDMVISEDIVTRSSAQGLQFVCRGRSDSTTGNLWNDGDTLTTIFIYLSVNYLMIRTSQYILENLYSIYLLLVVSENVSDCGYPSLIV